MSGKIFADHVDCIGGTEVENHRRSDDVDDRQIVTEKPHRSERPDDSHRRHGKGQENTAFGTE